VTTVIHERVEAARLGANPAVICRMPSGWAVLCDMQYLRGYSILLPDPVVGSINDLDEAGRARFLCDMVSIGDALLEVTGAYRINYSILGNSDPALHAHIVPRYQAEPEAIRRQLPWSYPPEVLGANRFDPGRDAELIARLAAAIRKKNAPAGR
jgi:diadenosine tetraphosphate (Ap4A) HIT family hydrolase